MAYVFTDDKYAHTLIPYRINPIPNQRNIPIAIPLLFIAIHRYSLAFVDQMHAGSVFLISG